jgi:hypothetical protein
MNRLLINYEHELKEDSYYFVFHDQNVRYNLKGIKEIISHRRNYNITLLTLEQDKLITYNESDYNNRDFLKIIQDSTLEADLNNETDELLNLRH